MLFNDIIKKMLFNDINFPSISPLKSEHNNNKSSFQTPQNRQYISHPEINKIKEAYYLKSGRSKKSCCNDSRTDIQTPTNSLKYRSLKENDKYELKVKNIIERRINIEEKANLKSYTSFKPTTSPEKNHEIMGKTLVFTPMLPKELYNTEEINITTKSDFNIRKELHNTEEFNITTKSDSSIQSKFDEALKKTRTTILKNSKNKSKINAGPLADISNSLIIKESLADDSKIKENLIKKLEEVHIKTGQETDYAANFDYNYKLVTSSKKKKHENIDNINENASNYIKEVYLDGSIYYGSKMNKLKHGKGIYIDFIKRAYAGEYHEGKKQGFGILKNFNGEIIYEGQWKLNVYHGKGKLMNINKKNSNKLFNYRNMDTIQDNWVFYEGEFYNGLYNGVGTLKIGNGKIYQGEFKQGFVHGHGIIFDNNNQDNKIEGEWRLNIYVSNLL